MPPPLLCVPVGLGRGGPGQPPLLLSEASGGLTPVSSSLAAWYPGLTLLPSSQSQPSYMFTVDLLLVCVLAKCLLLLCAHVFLIYVNEAAL